MAEWYSNFLIWYMIGIIGYYGIPKLSKWIVKNYDNKPRRVKTMIEKRNQEESFAKTIKYIAYALVVILILSGTIYIVPAGERGVFLTFGKPNMEPRGEGIGFKVPLMHSIKKIDVKTQKIETTSDSASADLQNVETIIALNFHIKPELTPKLYQEVGKGYKETVIDPAIEEAVKAVTAKYTAEELITKRQQVTTDMKILIGDKLDQYYMKVDSFNIINFQFSEEFDKAIEQKVTAKELMKKAEMDLQRIKIEANQKIAQAEGEAEALRLQKTQITPDLLELRRIELERFGLEVQQEAIEKWDGKLPQVTGGAVPFIDITTETT